MPATTATAPTPDADATKKRVKNSKPRYLRGDWVATRELTRGSGPGSKGYPAELQPLNRCRDMIAFPNQPGCYWKLMATKKPTETHYTKRWVKVAKSSAEQALTRQQQALKIQTGAVHPTKGKKVPVSEPVFKKRKGTTTGNNMFVKEFSQTDKGREAIKQQGGMLKAASTAWKNLSKEEKDQYKKMAAEQNKDVDMDETA
jgi:hypothetical protein